MTRKAFGYCVGDATRVIEEYRKNFAAGFEFGGGFVDQDKCQPLEMREQFRGLQDALEPGDAVILGSMRDLWKQTNALAILDRWLRRDIIVRVVDDDIVLNDHSPEGRNGQALVRALNKTSGHARYPGTSAALIDPRFTAFVKWGVKKVRRHGKPVLVPDPQTRDSMRLIVAMRDDGYSWPDIVTWLRGNGCTRNRRRWNLTTVRAAYSKEMTLRELEAVMAGEAVTAQAGPA